MPYEVPLDRVGDMADIAADAFVGNNDPIGNFMFRDEPRHQELKRRFFRSLVTSCSPLAVRHGISPDLEAVAIWFPPGMDHSGDADVDPFSISDFSNPGTMGKMQKVNDVIAALTANLGNEPQWYLHLVAVSPHFSGLGYSSLLVRPMLIMAEKEHLPCTLITQRLDNVSIYEHWGFNVVKEMPVPGSSERFWSMRKQ